MAKLSTHVLDTSRGAPAGGLAIDLYRRGPEETRTLLRSVSTNSDGRTGEPLLSGAELLPGIYELVFQAGAYFRALDIPLPEPPFLDEVVIRFGIADASASYHVPLLLAPYGYSTYRGS